MTKEKLTNKDLFIWEYLHESIDTLDRARQMFWAEETNRVGLIRHALSIVDTRTVFSIAPAMKPSELIELFDVWVEWAAYGHRFVGVVRDIIKSLPGEWVLSNIETYAEPLLRDGTYEEYRRLLELYIELDPALTRRLAQRASMSADEDIREAGEDFLDILANNIH